MAVKALTTIKHDGKLYKPGEIIESINSKDESRLISLGDAEVIEMQFIKDGQDSEEIKHLDDMSKKDLLAYGEELGLELNERMTVKDIKAAIKEQLENEI